MSNSTGPGPHQITLERAIEMTTLYRSNRTTIVQTEFEKDSILAICETFDKEAFRWFLDNPDCKSIRIYYGMSANLQVHAIVVGADVEDKDMLPATGLKEEKASAAADDDDPILEEAGRCPEDCPPPSALNQP